MHVWTHLKPESEGKTGLGVYADGMVEHDAMLGQLLSKLEELGISDNTIVMYSTDNRAEVFTWPDGGTTMFAGEKATQWEGGFRVPTAIRWPGVIEPGTIINEIGAHEDMLPTLLAAAGDPNVKEDLLKGRKVGGRNYRVQRLELVPRASPSPRALTAASPRRDPSTCLPCSRMTSWVIPA
jgi:arylsulfatase A-like enzyme